MAYNFYKKQNIQVLIYSIHLLNKNSKKKNQIKREKNNSTTTLMCTLK